MHSLPQDASRTVEASVLASKLGLSLPTTDDRRAFITQCAWKSLLTQQHDVNCDPGSFTLERCWILLHPNKPGASQQLFIGCAVPTVEL